MAERGVTQRVAVILAADAVGYTRLMAEDEPATIDALDAARAVFAEHVEANLGRIVDTAGDSVLAVFDATSGAVRAAIAIQDRLAEINEPIPEARRMRFRIGLHLGDIREKEDGTIYGDGVNIAARLEGLAEPGAIIVSDIVQAAMRDRLDIAFADAGRHAVKNVKSPVQAYRVLGEGEAAPAPPPPRLRRTPALATLASALVAIVVIAAVTLWPEPEPAPEAPPPEAVTADPDEALLPLPTGPSIAVLPFDNIGGEPEQEYFADGLTEDILTRLAAFQDLKVISRNSSFQYKGEAVDIRQIGRELGADFVLEGSVRRDAGSIRISAQLLDASDGAHVWQETYDRDLTVASIFAIQDEITEQVAAALGGASGAITTSQIKQIRGVPTNKLDSYECILLAKQYAVLTTPASHLTARTCLQDVVAKEPEYVDALAWLGQMYIEEIWSGYNPRDGGPSSLEAAFEVLTRAVQLDPNHQRARNMLAWAHYNNGDADQFFEEVHKAVAINPNDIETLVTAVMFIGYAGRWEESRELNRRMQGLGDNIPSWNNFTTFNYHYRNKDYVAAAEAARAGLDIEHWAGPWYLALAYAGLGEEEKALEALAKARAYEPNLTTKEVQGLVDALFLDRKHAALLMEGHAGLLALEESRKPSRPVIAVLPFDNLSGDPEQEYFADGITEDIITRLAQYPDILVLGRNTTFQFKSQAVDVREIGARLEADYLVEGSIRRAGETVRVNAQLLDTESGAHIWAETYDRALDPANLFAMQDEITEAVASRIGDPYGAIGRAEVQRSSRQAPKNLSSYECVLKYFAHLRNFNPDTHRVARDCLEEVADAETEYGEALAFLGNAYIAEVAFGFNASTESSLKRALDVIERGLAINPQSGRARVLFARALYLTDNPERAIREAEEALRLEPNNVEVLAWAGAVFTNTGAYDRAEEIMDKVALLNPNYPVWMNWIPAKAHMARGEYSDAITRLQMTQMEWWYWTKADIAACYCLLGDIERGREELDAALQANPGLAEVFWKENYFWNKGPGVRPFIDAAANGLRVCGWDVPPDPGREAFAQ